MATKIKDYKLSDGTIVQIQAIVDESEITRASKEDTISKNFEDTISAIKPVSEALFNTLKELNTPDEIQLEFGVSLGTKGGLIFVTADVEANFKISLKWKNTK